MTLDQLLETVPAYAKDLKLNFTSLLRQTELNEQQIWGTLVATAIAARNASLLEAVLADAGQHLSAQALEAARAAAAIMGMNNIYYRFQHLTTNPKYATLPARLRMNVMRSHGVDAADFELWCTAVSAINGCAVCIDSHEKKLRESGMTEETLLASVRIAAVVHALAAVLDAGAAEEAPAVAVNAEA
jgi:alkyl hydroperoxide reductase subunit D